MQTVDVIIALYNGERWIKQTLESVLVQTHVVGKVIVVDDGSKDASAQIVRNFQGVIYVENTEVHGHNGARNFGLKYSDAEFVAFMDHDDVWHTRHLELMLKGFHKYPQANAAVSGYLEFWEREEPRFDLSDQNCDVVDPWDLFPSVSADYSTTSALLFRRKTFVEAGGWPVDHKGPSDYSCWMRATADTPGIRLRASTLAYRRLGDSMFTRMDKDAMEYMKHRIYIAEELMKLRIVKHSDEEVLLRQRVDIYRLLYQVAGFLVSKSSKPLAETLSKIEEIFRAESSDFINACQKDLDFDLRRISADEQEYVGRYKFMAKHCSVNTPILELFFMKKSVDQAEVSLDRAKIKFFIKRIFPFVKYRWKIYAALAKLGKFKWKFYTLYKNILYFFYFRSVEIYIKCDLSKVVPLLANSKLMIEPISDLYRESLIEFSKSNPDKNVHRDWARYFFMHKYKGFVALQEGNIIGYFWWWARNCSVKPPPEMLFYNVKLKKDEAYGFVFFLAPQYRGHGNAAVFLNKVLLSLKGLGYTRLLGAYGANYLPAAWTYRSAGFKDLKTLFGHFFFWSIVLMENAIFIKNSSSHPEYPCEYRLLWSFRRKSDD